MKNHALISIEDATEMDNKLLLGKDTHTISAKIKEENALWKVAERVSS
jgi:hypothetical protein